MVIGTVDAALESLLRAALPLPAEVGDVSFDAPERSWGAQLSRLTVNLFLFDVARSPQPPRPPDERVRPDGRIERRPALPMVRLSYIVTAWAGSTGDEHQLLGEVLQALVTHQTIPTEHLERELPGAAQLALSQRDGRRPGDIWSALDGRLRPSLELEVTVPLSAGWAVAAPSVDRISGLVAPQPEKPEEAPAPRRATVRRDEGGNLVASAAGPGGDG